MNCESKGKCPRCGSPYVYVRGGSASGVSNPTAGKDGKSIGQWPSGGKSHRYMSCLMCGFGWDEEE